MALILVLDDNLDLAQLVAGALTDRGHAASVFSQGREAVAALERMEVHAAIVDLLLPDIAGQEVLRALADRGIPSIAMSGVFRGSRFAEQVTGAYGARAFFEKPFDLVALVTAVEELVGPGAAKPAPPVEEAPLEEAVDVDPRSPASEAALQALQAEREALPFATRRPASIPPPSAPRKREPLPALGPGAGQLAGTTVPKLLAAAHQSKVTGELRLKRGQVLKVIWLKEGRPLYAASNVAAERFGRYVVLRGAVKPEELVAVTELANREKLRTGEAMVRLGLLTPERRLELLHDQAQQILWSTFDWPDGEYQLLVRPVERPDLVPLQMTLPPMVLRGLAQLPLVRLRERVAPEVVLQPGQDPVFELNELGLSAEQARLVMAADGTKTRDDLLALADLPERDALALLLGLWELRALEPRPEPGSRRIVLI